MKALVIDDEQAFFDSIKPILRKGGFTPDYARDIGAARVAFEERTFDLILTDLQMPPGNWGGLEVIRAFRETDTAIPIFVASGKGTLAECIRAVRLGANDYIEKELFATEFVERIKQYFVRPYAIEYFPSVVGHLFRIYEQERHEYAKARRLIDVFENTMRILSVAIMSEYLWKSTIHPVDFLKQLKMDRPSAGSYVSFLFDRMKSDWGGFLLDELRSGDFPKLNWECDELINCRNKEFGHSVVISPERATKLVSQFAAILVRILNAVACLRRFQLIVPALLRFDGASFVAEGKLLQGTNLQHPVTSVPLSEPVPTNHAIVIYRGSVIGDLYPFLRIEDAPRGEWQIYSIYDKCTTKGIEFTPVPK